MEGFKIGSVIYIHGTTPDGGPGMVFNIRQGDDIVLHFNPRFNENCKDCEGYVVRNSHIGGSWGNEEKHMDENISFPFCRKKSYSAVIICQESGYEIAINGHYFTHFEHRLSPVKEFKKVTIEINPPPLPGKKGFMYHS